MIPHFDIYHTNLHSTFLLFDKFIDLLKQEFFNGYVLLDTGNQKCYLMLIDGEPHAHLLTEHEQTEFKSLSPKEFQKIIKNDCFIVSYRCAPQYIVYLSKCHSAKLIYKDLTSNSVNPENLLKKCQSGGFTGAIITDKNAGKSKAVYFDNGKILGTMNINANDDSFQPEITESAICNELKKIKFNMYEFAKTDDTVDTASGNRDSLIQCFAEIMQLLEKSAKGQNFSTLWRVNAQQLSGKYDFLDPFVAEFSYEDGKIDLWEKIEIKHAVKGMNELCETIAKSLRMTMDQIKEIKEKYKKILAAYEIRT